MNPRDYWERLYRTKPAETLGWYEPHLSLSIRWITSLGLPPDAAILDVGGGASTLVDDLLREGFTTITVLDLSAQALAKARERLGPQAQRVNWQAGDVTEVELPAQHYTLWHDRAAFHFLTTSDQQQRYVEQLRTTLRLRGHAIIGTFAEEAPAMCSGLPVQRYHHRTLQAILAPSFELMQHTQELHFTPASVQQMYLCCHFQRTS